MTSIKGALLIITFLFFNLSCHQTSLFGQKVVWDFGTVQVAPNPSNINPSTIEPATNVTVSSLADNSGGISLATSTPSDFKGASGNANAQVLAPGGIKGATSAYFEFSLTPAVGQQVTLTAVHFSSWSDITGPRTFDIRTSLDNYGNSIATGRLSNNRKWTFYPNTGLTMTSALSTAITVRIYGYDGTAPAAGANPNWKIDDLKIYLGNIVNPALTVNELVAENIQIASAELKDGYYTVSGYKNDIPVIRKVQFNQGESLNVWVWKSTIKMSRSLPHFIRLHAPTISIVTVPLKIRRAVDTFSRTVETGLTNVGVGINFITYKRDKYLSTGEKSSHTIGAGLLLSPSAQDITAKNTREPTIKESKQLFISVGLSVVYTYNDFSFAVVPIGFDLPTTSIGRKFVFQKRRWWGFGIGISTKLFGIF